MSNELWMWLFFLLVVGILGWYMLEITCCPYWSREPVLHTYDLIRRSGILNSTWKRGMTLPYKYVDIKGVSIWKSGEVGYSDAIEKYNLFLKKEWIGRSVSGDGSGGEGKDDYTRSFKLSAGDLEKGSGKQAVISSFKIAKYPNWDISFGSGYDMSGEVVPGTGWMMTYPIHYWISVPGLSCGGVLGDIFGGGNWGNKKEGETWKVDYLCVSRGDGVRGGSGKKDKVEVIRKLFTTHLYHLLFGVGGGGGSMGGGNVKMNSALFRADPREESMRKVIPVVRFGVVEVILDEKEVWPISKRVNWNQSRKKWVKVDMKNMSIDRFRLWKKWMNGWYSSGGGGGRGNGGALGGIQMIGVLNWNMVMDKVATEDWFVWVLYRPRFSGRGEGEEGEEIECVLFFRNEWCVMEHKDEIRGMAGSGREIITLIGSWFIRGISLWEGKDYFRRGLREMRGIRKTLCVLRIECLGYNIGLMESLRQMGNSGGGKSGNELEIGKIVNQEMQGYYFYNRFWNELDSRNCFILL